MDVHAAAVMAVPVVAFIVWLVRLEGRVNGHDDKYAELRDDVRYIRDRIDKALNGQ